MLALIAEDTDVGRRMLAVMVEQRGHDVVAAAAGGAAWEAFERLRPGLVILDCE